MDNLRFQNGTSNVGRGGRRFRPYAFTQEGISMLSGVLRSPRAVQANIAIMRTFVRLREMLANDRSLQEKLIELERKCDLKFKSVFDAIHYLMSFQAAPRKKILGLRRP